MVLPYKQEYIAVHSGASHSLLWTALILTSRRESANSCSVKISSEANSYLLLSLT